MLGTDTRIIKTCGDRIYGSDLAVLILAEIGLHAVEDTESSRSDSSRSLESIYASARSLTAYELNVLILNEVVESTDRIGAASDTCRGSAPLSLLR